MLHMISETNSPAAVVRSGMVRMLMHVGSMCDCFGLQDALLGLVWTRRAPCFGDWEGAPGNGIVPPVPGLVSHGIGKFGTTFCGCWDSFDGYVAGEYRERRKLCWRRSAYAGQ